MTARSALLARGAAERDELVEVYRDRRTGRLRAERWGPDGSPAPGNGEEHVGTYCGPVVCVPLGWGRWEVAQEEVPRLAEIIRLRAAVLRLGKTHPEVWALFDAVRWGDETALNALRDWMQEHD